MVLWKHKLKLFMNRKVMCDFCCKNVPVGGTFLSLGAGITCMSCADNLFFQIKEMLNAKASNGDAVQKPNDGQGSNVSMLHDISKRRGKDPSSGSGRRGDT
jgi:hypothetical protein